MGKDVVDSEAIVAKRNDSAIATDVVWKETFRSAGDTMREALRSDSAGTTLRNETSFDCMESGEHSLARTTYFSLSPGNNVESSKVSILDTPSKLTPPLSSSMHCPAFAWPSSASSCSAERTNAAAVSSDPTCDSDSRVDGSRAGSACERTAARLFSPGSLEASYAGLGGTANFSASASKSSAALSSSSTSNTNQVAVTAAVAMAAAAVALVNSSDYKVRIDETPPNSEHFRARTSASQNYCGSKLGVPRVLSPPPSPPTPPLGLAPPLSSDVVLPLDALDTSKSSILNARYSANVTQPPLNLEARLNALQEVVSSSEIKAPQKTIESNDTSLVAIEAENRSLREELSIASKNSQTKNTELEKKCRTMEGECESLRATVAELERRLLLCEARQQEEKSSQSSVPLRLNVGADIDIATSSSATTNEHLGLGSTSASKSIARNVDMLSTVASHPSELSSSSCNVDPKLSHAIGTVSSTSVNVVSSIVDKQPPQGPAKESIDSSEIRSTSMSAPSEHRGNGDVISVPALFPHSSNIGSGVSHGAFAVSPSLTPLMSASSINDDKLSGPLLSKSAIDFRSAEWKTTSLASRATSSTTPSTSNFSQAGLSNSMLSNNPYPNREVDCFSVGARSISPRPIVRGGPSSSDGSSRKAIRSVIGLDLELTGVRNAYPSSPRPSSSAISSSVNSPQRLTTNLDSSVPLSIAQRSSLFDNLRVTPRSEVSTRRPVSPKRSDAVALSSTSLDDSTASVFNQSQAMPPPESRYSMLRICENLPRQLYSRRL